MENTAGVNNPNRLYTDFEPYCIWHRKEDSDTLDVHLDGFIKEQLKVQINSSRILTISGQRPLNDKNDNNKWSRFRKQIKLADNAEDKDIRSKLSRGILSIVMPKKPGILSLSIPLPSDVLQTAQTQDVLAQSKPPEKATTEVTQKGAQTQDVSAQSKPPEKATTATTQKGNDTVSSSENAELSGMKLGSYLLGQKESGGWMLKMDENMGVKVGLVLVFLLLGVCCLCKMFM